MSELTAALPKTRNRKDCEKIKSPLSVLLRVLVWGAAILTFFALFFLIGFILVKGIPHLKPSLFSLNYTSENVSMLPSIINTVKMLLLALVISGPISIFTAIIWWNTRSAATNW